MPMGIVGRKAGMTRVFNDAGESVSVTVVQVAPNRVTAVKTVEKDGYSAMQVTAGERRASLLTKAEIGHFKGAGVEAGRGLWEFRTEDVEQELAVGQENSVTLFEAGQKVDVSGVTIGKGFAGGVKRHNFKMQDATHGNSVSHRAPGSIGQNQTPGRVFKGKKMAGHMGAVRRTIQNLEVVRVDEERQLLLISGSVPGAAGGDVFIKPSVKAG
ncbi:50S ribosomal protein L3 [Chromatiales bacterium (ex Bugula neritina AB1)]|nr:50S ribosomal protein L3 [Chromatiales bacterium (ex Bugula neritina AB1)]